MMGEPLGQREEKVTGFTFLGNDTKLTINDSVINVLAGKNEVHSSVEQGSGAKPKRLPTCSNDQKQSPVSAPETDSSSTAIDRPCHIWNDVWMHVDSAQIFSYFCKDKESVKDLRQYLEPDHKRIMRLPREVFTRVGNKLQTIFESDTPADMQLTTLDDDKFEILSTELQRNWFEICYESVPHPDELQHPNAYKLTYQAKLFNDESEPIEGGFMTHLQFRWPLIPKQQERSEQGASSSGRNITVSNLHVERDVYIGGQGTHTDNRAAPSRNVDSLPAADYLSQTHAMLQESCAQQSCKMKMIGPDGGSIELDKCQVDIQPDVNARNKEVKITVNSNPEDLPGSSAVASHAFKCQPSQFEKQVQVRIILLLTPQPGEKLRVDVMSKTGNAAWRKTQEAQVDGDGKLIYNAPHFCWHVAVVSEEEEKKGLYHLLSDVWMHKETGRILSLFWKDEVLLKKGSKALEADHKRIISVPSEVIVGIGSTIKVEVECRSSAGLKMLSVDGSNSTLEITHEAMKKNFLSLLFEPNLRPDAIQSAERFRVVYRTKVFDAEDQLADGGFCTLLHYRWPMLRMQEPAFTGARQLKFINVTDTKHDGLHLNTDALAQVLCQPGVGDKPVAVIGIAGHMRTGKSLIINILQRYLRNKGWDNSDWIEKDETYQEGFVWRGGITQCTEGIWICDGGFTVKKDNGEELTVLLVDTQGLNSHTTAFEPGMKIFTLTGLLCSHLILNIMRQITEDVLQYFELFTTFAKSNKKSEAPVQDLMFLIRDWAYDDVYEYGLKGGESYWANVANGLSMSVRPDRHDPYSVFQSIQCFTMPPAGFRVRKLETRNADEGSDFLTLASELAQSVLNPSNLRVRKHNGRPMTGRQLWFFMKVCYDALWIKGERRVEGIGRGFEQAETRLAFEDGIKMFKEKLREVQDTVNPSELDEVYHIAIDDALQHFEQNTVDAGSQYFEQKSTSDDKSFSRDYRAPLISECQEYFKGISAWTKFRNIRANNQSMLIIREVSTEYTTRMEEDIKEEFHSIDKLERFHHKHSAAAKLEYQTNTAKESVFHDDHLKLLHEDIEHAYANLRVVNGERHILQALGEQDDMTPDYQGYLLRHQIAQQYREDFEKFKSMHIEEEKLKELFSALQQSYTKMFEESWHNKGANMQSYRDNLRQVLEKDCKHCIRLNKRNKEIFQNCLEECVAKAEVIYHEHMYQLIEDDYCQPSDLDKAHEITVEKLECDIKAELEEIGIPKQVEVIDRAKRIFQDRFAELRRLNNNNQEEKPPVMWEVVEQKLTEAGKRMSRVLSRILPAKYSILAPTRRLEHQM